MSIELQPGERFFTIRYYHEGEETPHGGTWLLAVTCVDPIQSIRDEAKRVEQEEPEKIEYGYLNWGDAMNVLDLERLGIRDVTPYRSDWAEVAHDEALAYLSDEEL